MASDFVVPRLPAQRENSFSAPLRHVNSAPISPLNTCSNGSSPTSPKSYHTRQVRPAYIPAVLRPNEHASKLPPRAARGCLDGQRAPRPNTGPLGPAAIGGVFSMLCRRSSDDSDRYLEEDLDPGLFPKPTGQPTRQHWKPDAVAFICDELSCQKHFGFFVRRHHCRRCGNVFCDEHSRKQIPLDQDARYNPRGLASRSCDHCFVEYHSWRSRTNSTASSEGNGTATPLSAPIDNTRRLVSSSPVCSPNCYFTSSGPYDWNWSTF